MTEAELIDAILDREGREYEEPPQIDQPTAAGGITAAALAEDRGLPVSDITPAALRAVTVEQARGIIGRKMRRLARDARFDRIAFEPLRAQLLDYAWNSGEERAVRWLQRTVGIAEGFLTGRIDDRTLVALNRYPPVLINNALAASRAHAAYHGGTAPKFAEGVAHRAIEFVISTVGDLEGEVVET
jgi:lysozyme family protein